MSTSTYRYTQQEWDDMIAALPAAGEAFRLSGQLTEVVMDLLNIPKTKHVGNRRKPKHERVLQEER